MPFFGDFGIWFDDGADMTAPGWGSMFGGHIVPDTDKPLAQRVVSQFDATRKDVSPGRRLRTFAQLVDSHNRGGKIHQRHRRFPETPPLLEGPEGATYGQAYGVLQGHEAFVDLSLRWGIANDRALIHEWKENRFVATTNDPELHPALQDLGAEILSDVHDACYAFNDPGLYYPGIDDGIEPVSDDHVKLVIWALQRELNRETRGHPTTGARLPAVPLTELPWRIQRALAERRRFRFLQYGITKERWLAGKWSLLDIREDPDFVPRRWLRQ